MEKMLILSTIDDLNQYLNGNVTKEGLIESLDILKKLEHKPDLGWVVEQREYWKGYRNACYLIVDIMSREGES